MSSLESRPVAHATDTYNKHRSLWPPVYDKIWLEQQIVATGSTFKGDLQQVTRQNVKAEDRPALKTRDRSKAKRRRNPLDDAGTVITGEPMHELINLRKALPNLGNDFADIYFDHADACLQIGCGHVSLP